MIEGRAVVAEVRQIGEAALPLYLTMLAATAGQLVDTAAVGRHATVSLAAFAVAMATFLPAVTAASGAVRGAIPDAALAAGEPAERGAVARAARLLAMAVGAVAALPVLATGPLTMLSGVTPAVRAQLSVLPVLLAGSVLAASLGSAATSLLIGLGRADLVARAGLAGTAVAVLLSPALVAGFGPLPRLGLAGAGVAMLTATTVSAGIAHLALRRSAGSSGEPAAVTVARAVRIARVGLPLAGTVLIKFAGLGVLAVAAARIGPTAAATHSILIALANLLFVTAAAVGQAVVAPLARQHAGGRPVGAELLAALAVAVGGVAVSGAVLAALGGAVVPVFTADPVVRTEVSHLLGVVLLVVCADAVQVVLGFALTGIKRTTASLLAFAACYPPLMLAAVPIAAGAGLRGLWTGLAAVNLLLAAAQGWLLHRLLGARPTPFTPS